MALPKRVRRAQAVLAQTQHVFRHRKGYFYAGPLTAPAPRGERGQAKPPEGTVDGSGHVLETPGGGQRLLFTWVAAESAWARQGGNRMAWTADHLAAAGWNYIGPVETHADRMTKWEDLQSTEGAHQ